MQTPRRLVTINILAATLKIHKSNNESIVFTNGCFDIFHRGHLELLKAASLLGDVLVVAVNSDAGFFKHKERDPFIGESDRAALIAELTCVDYVCLFDERSVESLILELEPDVLVKGGDYKSDADVVGANYVKSLGGRVVRLPQSEGYSSSQVIQRIQGSLACHTPRR
jgi:rfaE bifunctional protein nucleotidyltransferase chain/domain